MSLSEPATRNGFHAGHIKLLSDSLEHWSGHGLMIDETDPLKASRNIYLAPFALLSHGAEADPVINYANHTAQQLFEMNWDAFTTLPSRLSAEAPVQAEREALLRRVAKCGYIDDYCGVRISSSGKRFLIEQATVWNLLDGRGEYCGQAAMFAVWQPLASGIDSAAESNHD